MRPRLLTPILMSNIMVSLRNSTDDSRKRRLMKVKKDLFGPVNHADSHEFVERELRSMSEADNAKWNFDFQNEKPLDVPNPRYLWEKVTPSDSIPQAYAFQRICINNNNNIVIKEDSKSERQTQITEFMKYSRKRRISVTSKLTEDLEPEECKRSRSLTTTTS